MRITLLSFFFLCFVFVTKAQQKLPAFNYVPQAPTTEAFTRYGDIPVDLSTGVTAISIPIYTFSENGINIPISISYHASGIKVDDIASSVGLGWTLNAGGVITRTIMGIKDELLDIRVDGKPIYLKPPFKNAREFVDSRFIEYSQNRYAWADYVFGIMGGGSVYDFYSDRFYYNLGNGESGVFRKDFITDVIKFMPYKPMKVRLIPDNSVFNGLKIEMITSDGTRYLFKRNKYDTWHPEKIFNSSNTDSVVFYTHADTLNILSYDIRQEFGPYRSLQTNRTEAYMEPVSASTCKLMIRGNHDPRFLYQGSYQEDEVVLVDSIVGTNGVVRFTYTKDREDATSKAPRALSRVVNIQVFNKLSGLLIKNVNFSHSYLGNSASDKRLMLNGIQTGVNGEEKYEFEYNPEMLPGYYMTYNSSSSTPVYLQDFWGYYRGGAPSFSNMFIDFAPGGHNLFPNENMAKAGILQEIKYPTGGKTVFEYESHRVPSYFFGPGFIAPPAEGKVGGLRIKKISSYTHEGAVPQVKTYEYVCDLPKEYGELNYHRFSYSQDTWNHLGQNFNSCGADPAEFGLSHKNVCVNSAMGRYIGGPKAPVYYSQVTEYNGDGNKNAGKTVYHYKMPDPYTYGEIASEPRYSGPWDTDYGSYLPPLEKKEEYKYENGQYQLVRKTENEYGGNGSQMGTQFPTGFNLTSDLEFNSLNLGVSAAFFHYNYLRHEDYFFTLHYEEPRAFAIFEVPSKISVYDYVDGNNYLLTSTEYNYNQYGQQIAANTTTSKGELLKTKFTYPVDYPAQSPYNTMIERNNISPVIEQSTYKNNFDPNNLLSSIKTNYKYWDYANQTWGGAVSNQILPQTVETQKGVNNPETRMQYFSYDQKSNPVYVAKENDTRQLYIWSYNKTYPVAQVMNVADEHKQFVSYTSFEDSDYGNWSISGPQVIIDDNTAPTGKKCLRLTSFVNINQSLNAGSSYILSYWYKTGGAIYVNGNSTILTTSQPKNGWVYVKRRVTGTSLLSISGSFSQIDELRLYPETAQMTTFSYEPLVGMTAQCDINDKITYYSYDASGRLSLVKDDNGNVLKKICYNFQGQPDACGENALPKWQLTGNMKCKPCAQSPGHFTPITQVEERDNNVNSETYGNSRWRDSGVISGPGACAVGDWQLTGNLRCKTIGSQNTGEQEREWKDMNPCSPNSGQSTWENMGMNTAACPKPAIYQSQDVSGNYYKQGCSSTQVTFPYYVSMPQGAYTSSVSVQDATNLARQAAQQQANQNAQCVTVYVKAVMVPNPNGNPNDSYRYGDLYFYFYSDAAGTVPLTLPVDVTINYSVHIWWVNDGTVSDQGILDGWYTTGSSNSNYAVEHDFEISYCVGTSMCRYQEIIMNSGNYVIIP